MDSLLLQQAGLSPDPLDPRGAYFLVPSGERVRVFLKRARSPERRAVELSALALLRDHAPDLPLTHVITSIDLDGAPYLAFAYLAGANLADLLAPGPLAPPRAPWYEPSGPLEKPPIRALLPLLSELGQAVRILHSLRLELFGRLPGTREEPNPYRDCARAFTFQEISHGIHMALEKGALEPAQAEEARAWAARAVECLADDEPPCLVHYDLHAGNVRVGLEEGQWRLLSVYDFELARAWLPEWDLAALAWDLSSLSGEDSPGQAWEGFLAGYGPVDAARLRLFMFLRLLSAVAYADRYPDWARWSLERLRGYLTTCTGQPA